MTAEKQLKALKWVASTFGIFIVGLIWQAAMLTSQVEQNTKDNKATDERVDELWDLYDGEGAEYRTKVDQFEEKFKNMEKDELKKLFDKYKTP